MARISRDQAVDEARPKRTPVSGNRNILTVDKIPAGKVARWVNDDGNRLLKFLQGGWEFVTDTGIGVGEKTVEASRGVGSVVYRLVGTKAGNEPLYAYLMIISKEWYDEDQIAKEVNLRADESEIFSKFKKNDEDNTYGNMNSEVKIEDGV